MTRAFSSLSTKRRRSAGYELVFRARSAWVMMVALDMSPVLLPLNSNVAAPETIHLRKRVGPTKDCTAHGKRDHFVSSTMNSGNRSLWGDFGLLKVPHIKT